jgi:hypothetical protein
MAIVYITLTVIAVIFLLGFLEKNIIHTPSDYLVSGGIASLLFLLIYVTTINTYLEIQDQRTLRNSGYRDIGYDNFDILNIKYIYRASAFIWRSGGSLMLIYIRDEDGRLKLSKVREVNYPNDTLKRFLRRITQLNPSIELDQEYSNFLSGKYDDEDRSFGRWVKSSNSIADIEARLHTKGEKW